MTTESMKGKDSVTTSNWRGNNIETCEKCGHDRNAIREMIAQGGKSNMTIVWVALENCPACKRAIEGVK